MAIEMIEDFSKWKDTLHKAVHVSRSAGMNDDTVVNIAERIGDFLSKNVDPKNPQQRVIKELWEVGTHEERHVFAQMMVKMVEKEQHSIN